MRGKAVTLQKRPLHREKADLICAHCQVGVPVCHSLWVRLVQLTEHTCLIQTDSISLLGRFCIEVVGVLAAVRQSLEGTLICEVTRSS